MKAVHLILLFFTLTTSSAAFADCPAMSVQQTFSPTASPSLPKLHNPLLPNATGPLNMVAFGDSVVWGNGDAFEHKLVNLIAQYAADTTGRQVNFLTWAHSGAWLGNGASGGGTPMINGVFAPEVSTSVATTITQTNCASSPASVELVVMDGCINDIGAENIAIPWPFNLTTPEQIRSSVYSNCTTTMRTALDNVNTLYPNATVILLSYFRIVSDKSFLAAKASPVVVEQTTPSKAQNDLTKAQMKFLLHVQAQGKLSPAATGLNRPLTARDVLSFSTWPVRSDVFLKETTQCFNWAIANANHASPPALSGTLPAEGMVCPNATLTPAQATTSARTYLASYPDDDPSIAYGTSNTNLWKLPWRFLFWIINKDETYDQRHDDCKAYYVLASGLDKDIDIWGCTLAETAHPNPKGARAYAEAAEKQLAIAWAQ